MVNTYQPINPTALEALALMRDQAEYRQVTIPSTAVGNALCVTQESARRNMRFLVDMNLLEVVVPQRGGLAATYRIPPAVVKDEVIMEVTADPADVSSVSDGAVKARRVHVVEDLRWKW